MKIDFQRLDHIMICIPEGTEDAARSFYGGILGLQEVQDPGHPLPKGAIWYQMRDIQLHVRAEEHHSASKRHPAFIVSNLEQSKNWLEANGITVKVETKMPGRDRFSFRDPFGNTIELIELSA